jgi:hypothetical protein
MASLTVVWWRDIPAQVIARAGRSTVKRELPSRFAEAIDMAAMRGGARSADAYLEDWRKSDPTPCGEDLAAEVDRTVAEMDAAYDHERLKALVANGGRGN